MRKTVRKTSHTPGQRAGEQLQPGRGKSGAGESKFPEKGWLKVQNCDKGWAGSGECSKRDKDWPNGGPDVYIPAKGKKMENACFRLCTGQKAKNVFFFHLLVRMAYTTA